jgi:hypothetical protein
VRISIAELEICRANPAIWVRNKLNPSSGGPRLGFAGATKLAIYKYHETQSPDDARLHLARLLSRFRSEDMKADAEANLEAYIAWCNTERPAVAARKSRLSFNLGHEIILGGEVSRIDADIATGGYRAILLGDAPAAWEHELRMPLIQRAIARAFHRDEREVRVGFQELDASGLTVRGFSEAEMDEGERTARELAGSVAALLLSHGGR